MRLSEVIVAVCLAALVCLLVAGDQAIPETQRLSFSIAVAAATLGVLLAEHGRRADARLFERERHGYWGVPYRD